MVANAVNQVWTPRFLAIASQNNSDTLDRENVRATTLLEGVIALTAAMTLMLCPCDERRRVASEGLRWSVRLYGNFVQHICTSALLRRDELLSAASRGRFVGAHRCLDIRSCSPGLVIALATKYGSLGVFIGWALVTVGRAWTVALIGKRKWGFNLNLWAAILPTLSVVVGWFIGRNLG